MEHTALKQQILDLVGQFGRDSYTPTAFQPGITPVPAAGKVVGDTKLEAEGKAEKWSGKAKGAVDKAVDDVTDDNPRR